MSHEITNTGELIEETISIFRAARNCVVQGMVNLARIKETGEWQSRFSSWGEFLEDGLGISQAQGSKLLSSHQGWVVEAGIDPERLIDIDLEKLYYSVPMLKEGNPEEVLSQARVLTRAELRATRQEKAPHEFEPRELCKICGATRENHQ